MICSASDHHLSFELLSEMLIARDQSQVLDPPMPLLHVAIFSKAPAFRAHINFMASSINIYYMATRAGKMVLSCLLGITHCVPRD